MFLLVPAHPGFPGQIPQSRKTVVCVCVFGKFKLRVTCKSVTLYITEGPWRVAFELKFYPDPMLLHEEATR